MPKVPGLIKGLGVTFGEMVKTLKDGPGHRAVPPREGRAHPTGSWRHRPERGELHRLHAVRPRVPRLVHLHRGPQVPRPAATRRRQAPPDQRSSTASTSTYSLCMYCGICVEVCPFEALFWSPEYEYSELRIADLLHDKERLGEWMETVPDFEAYEAGSEAKVKKVPPR